MEQSRDTGFTVVLKPIKCNRRLFICSYLNIDKRDFACSKFGCNSVVFDPNNEQESGNSITMDSNKKAVLPRKYESRCSMCQNMGTKKQAASHQCRKNKKRRFYVNLQYSRAIEHKEIEKHGRKQVYGTHGEKKRKKKKCASPRQGSQRALRFLRVPRLAGSALPATRRG